MDQKPIINVLIIADALADGEQLVNILRKAGFGVHAEAVRSEEFLRERLIQRSWDLLFIFFGNRLLTTERLHAVLREMDQDLPSLVLGGVAESNLPEGLTTVSITDLQNPQQGLLLLRAVSNQLADLRMRRDLRKTSAALKELQQRYQLLLNSASDAVCYLHDGLHVYANKAYSSLFGYSSTEELRGIPFLDLVDDTDVEGVGQFLRHCQQTPGAQHPFHAITGTDSRAHLSLECAVAAYEGERSLQVILRPVTGNVEQQLKTRSRQSTDLLTNLLNRSGITTRIEQAIADAIYEHTYSTLLLFSLQGFDDLANEFGRPTANLLLADVARLLTESATQDVMIGRCGESEFAMLQRASKQVDHETLLLNITNTLNADLQKRLPQGAAVSLVAGAAAINELSPDAEVIITRARHNLTVRQTRSNSAGTPEDPYGTSEQMFQRLEEAFEKEDFVLVFQPVVSLKEDGVQRYEVRIRLQDKGYMIYPPRFLELANQHGLGEKIDRWVTQKTLRLLQERNNPNLQMIINLTQNSIVSAEFLPWLQQQLRDFRQPADRIVLQISELDIVSSPEQVGELCQQLQQLRLKLSITHFGCTLTPFKYLPHEGAEYVKLDKSLLTDIGLNLGQRDKLNTTVNGLHARGLLVIAPMIDQINLLPLLWQANVNFVQGNCLQEPTDKLDFSFVQDEELTLDSFH